MAMSEDDERNRAQQQWKPLKIRYRGALPVPASHADPSVVAEVESMFAALRDWNDRYWRANHDPGDEDVQR